MLHAGMIALTCTTIAAGVAVVCVAAIAVTIGVFNLRRGRAMRIARAVPGHVREQVLACIDRAGRRTGDAVLLLRPVGGARPGMASFVGGAPVLPRGVVMPERVEHGLRFLAQVRLGAPPLPSRWRDRLALVLADEREQVVAVTVELPANCEFSVPEDRLHRQCLDALHLPGPGGQAALDEDGVPLSPYQPSVVLERVPELRALLSGFAVPPERILPYLMVPGIFTHEIDTAAVCLMGGEPEWIQDAHDATCSQCGRAMTFLFQLGDVLGLRGDAPCVYFYGCDEHPDEVEARVDMH